MTESGDYTPAPHWKGYDFDKQRRAYDVHVKRSYADAVVAKKTLKDVFCPKLTTLSRAPCIIATDQTGSMGTRTSVVVSKLPYLDHEGREYLGEDMEISFAAIGDATNHETYPLQVRPFAKGADMKARAEELVIEGKGGGTKHESYELAAAYFARNVTMPNAVHPLLIFIGDEMPYETVSPDLAKTYAGVTLSRAIPTAEIFAELKLKFSVYIVLAPYGDEADRKYEGDRMGPSTQKIHAAWAALLGEDHIAYLPDAGRVVDVIFGIFAKETARIPYFRGEIEGRQRPEQVKTVYKSLETIHASMNPSMLKLPPGQSVLRDGGVGTEKTKPLI